MLLKDRLGKTSSIPDFSINKAAKIAGVSPSTIKRYLPIWESNEMIEFQGSQKDVLVVKRLSSSTKHRNYVVDRLDFSSFKRLYNSFRDFLFLIIQSRKDFIKRILRIATNPRRGEDFRAAKTDCKHYVRLSKGDLTPIYHEFGLSYKRIAKKLGFCVKTAQNIVSDTIHRRWCKKKTHYQATYLQNVNGMYVEGFTFTTQHYGYVVSANTYAMSRSWGMVLIGGKK